MPSAEQSIAVNAPIEKVFEMITDFETYPDFQPEIVSAETLKKSTTSAEVAFSMNMIQKVDYILKFKLKKPKSITWEFVEGDSILKDNSGSWKLESLEPNLTDVTYKMNVELNMWLPTSVIDSLLADHIPKMLERFKERAESA